MPKINRTLFIWANAGLLATLVAVFVRDGNREWKKYQKQYFALEAQELEEKAGAAANPEEQASLLKQAQSKRRGKFEIRQIIVKDLVRIDRCITCHVGMDSLNNPSLTTNFSQNPYKGHPGDFLKTHSPTKYGCTICHQGQGLATTAQAAHGFIKHWEEPALEAPFIQASCAKCHDNFESLPYAETAAEGKRLFAKNGCYGCHGIKGWGANVSEDLGEIASKPLSQIDFSATGLPREQWNVKNWILAHLTQDPLKIVPGDPEGRLGPPVPPSGMPPFYLDLKEEQAQAITSYLLSMSAEKTPYDYHVYAPPKPEPVLALVVERGKHVFDKYGCAGCHGIEASGGRRNFNALGPGQDPSGLDPIVEMAKGRAPDLRETVGTFTHEELKAKIQSGVPPANVVKFKADGPTPPLFMPPWKEKIKDRELEDLIAYLFSIAKKTEEW